MLDVPARRHRTADEPMVEAARRYALLGWPALPGASPAVDGTRACSCDRIGCPAPAAHPRSQAWRWQVTADDDTLTHWWAGDPDANIILPTGRVFDVLDLPADTGRRALARMEREDVHPGPVAAFADERYLFFVATRGAPVDEDEWWSCHLDCVPETVADNPGVRWHCRDSYVVAPPSTLPYGRVVTWVVPPWGTPLPDPMHLLGILPDSRG